MNSYKSVAKVLSIAFLFIASSCNIEPFEGDIPEEIEDTLPSSCEEAAINTGNAALAFGAVSTTDSNYSILCSAYKNALQDQVVVCGDEGDVFQTLIDSIGDCGEDDGEGDDDGEEEVEIRAFMTANINGVQYNDMKPNGYLFFPGGAWVNGFIVRDDTDYLVIQGNSGYQNPTFIAVTDREINLKIPSVFWKEGTYDLYDDYNDVFEGVCYFTYFSHDTPDGFSKVDKQGEIIISKFSLEERVIEGTFEFEYTIRDNSDYSEGEAYKVTGTFDYSLDDEFFD